VARIDGPAGLGWRIGARTIDVIAVTWLVVFVTVEIDQRLLGGDPLGRRQARVVFDSARPVVILLLLILLYEVVPVVLYGATPGKALLGLRVRSVTRGMPVALAAIGRAAILYVPLLFLGPAGVLVPIVLLASVALAADGRGLHDRLLGTLVVSPPREDDR
jgi:uncharacterized RDD family membrane protein YckC